jgi:hypothetical protein
MDALHDDRKAPPHYRSLNCRAPLPDDDPRFVQGLAVEITTGDPTVEYKLGPHLQINGELIAAIDVDVEAPNDIVSSRRERTKIVQAREQYGRALAHAWRQQATTTSSASLGALVIRHRPGRDEDNTWETWVGALLGTSNWCTTSWGGPGPLPGWRPRAIASLTDAALDCAVRYELYQPS